MLSLCLFREQPHHVSKRCLKQPDFNGSTATILRAAIRSSRCMEVLSSAAVLAFVPHSSLLQPRPVVPPEWSGPVCVTFLRPCIYCPISCLLLGFYMTISRHYYVHAVVVAVWSLVVVVRSKTGLTTVPGGKERSRRCILRCAWVLERHYVSVGIIVSNVTGQVTIEHTRKRA